jgi:hypothetical protein
VKRPKASSHTSAADTTEAVDELMRTLNHPCKAAIELIRTTMLSTDSAVAEGVKWNAPSFRTTGYFATTHLRAKNGIGVILHLGAKVRTDGTDEVSIRDPERLLTWLEKDRAMVVFKDGTDFIAKKAAFERIVRQWIKYV